MQKSVFGFQTPWIWIPGLVCLQLFYFEHAQNPGIWGVMNATSNYGTVYLPWDTLPCNSEPCWAHQPYVFGFDAESCSGHGMCLFEPPYNKKSWRWELAA